MSPEQEKIEATVKSVEGLTDQINLYTGGRIDQLNEALDYDIYSLEAFVNLSITRVEMTLIGPIAILYQNATYHTLRAYYQASPGLMAVLAVVWGVIKSVWQVVKYIIEVWKVVQEFGIDDLLAQHWKWFNEARESFRKRVSELSAALGWGVDGFLHILHAVQGTTDVLGGLMGRTFSWMDADWMVKTGNILELTNRYATRIQEEPGEVLEILFQ